MSRVFASKSSIVKKLYTRLSNFFTLCRFPDAYTDIRDHRYENMLNGVNDMVLIQVFKEKPVHLQKTV